MMYRSTTIGPDDGDGNNYDEDKSGKTTIYTIIIAVISAIFVVFSAMWMTVFVPRKPVSEQCREEWQHEGDDAGFDDDNDDEVVDIADGAKNSKAIEELKKMMK